MKIKIFNKETTWKESTKVWITQNKQEKKEETITEKMKRSPDERHTQTHGSFTGTF